MSDPTAGDRTDPAERTPPLPTGAVSTRTPLSSCLPFLRITAPAGCVLRFSLGLPPSSTCVLRIEGNDRPETRCRTEGIDSRPVSLPEFLQPARLALSFSATSIRQSHRGTDQQPDQSRLVWIRRGSHHSALGDSDASQISGWPCRSEGCGRAGGDQEEL